MRLAMGNSICGKQLLGMPLVRKGEVVIVGFGKIQGPVYLNNNNSIHINLSFDSF